VAPLSLNAPAWKPPPSTRFIRRQGGARGWTLGILVTLMVNVGVILVLSQISHVRHGDEPRAPDAVRHLTHIPPPPPIEEPVEQSAEKPATAPAPAAAATPLPSLDLPPLSGDPDLALPALGIETPLNAPWTAPSFHAIAAPSAPALAPDLLDEMPQLAESFELERFYPHLARLHHIEGESLVRIAINAHGEVTACTVMRSSPAGVFDQAVVQLAMNLRYHPAKRSGQAVAATVNLTISWTLQ
jgi:TonB family protein